MDDYLRFGLLFIAVFVLSFIFIESWWRRRRFKSANLNANAFHTPPVMKSQFNDDVCSMTLAPTEDPIMLSAIDDIQTKSVPLSRSHSAQADYLAISVFAKNNGHFESYDLLQAISATGMQFGPMNIFHYYQTIDGSKKTFFSLASATKPGEFNLDRMGEVSCSGLTLFMDLRDVSIARVAFEKMLKTAQQLADDLDGELRENPRTPWTPLVLQQYRNRIQQITTSTVLS